MTRGGEEIRLTATEFELLRYLMRNPRAGAVEGADPRPRVAVRLRRPGQHRRALHLLPAPQDRRGPRADDPHPARRRVRAQAREQLMPGPGLRRASSRAGRSRCGRGCCGPSWSRWSSSSPWSGSPRPRRCGPSSSTQVDSQLRTGGQPVRARPTTAPDGDHPGPAATSAGPTSSAPAARAAARSARGWSAARPPRPASSATGARPSELTPGQQALIAGAARRRHGRAPSTSAAHLGDYRRGRPALARRRRRARHRAAAALHPGGAAAG